MTEEQIKKLDKVLLYGRKMSVSERRFVVQIARHRGWTLSEQQSAFLDRIYTKITEGQNAQRVTDQV